jgi:hypothetical protein
MSLNFTPEQEAEMFEHLYAIQGSLDRISGDVAEIRACFDRIDRTFETTLKQFSPTGVAP